VRDVKGFTRREKDVEGEGYTLVSNNKNWGKDGKNVEKPVRRAEGGWVYTNVCKVFPPMRPIFFLLLRKKNEQKTVTSSKFMVGEAGSKGTSEIQLDPTRIMTPPSCYKQFLSK
jgi:hypothetical protein